MDTSGRLGGTAEYQLTAPGRELKPLIDAFGVWGQGRVEKELSLTHLDVSLLMWDMRRNINPSPMPRRRCMIHVKYPERPPGALGGRR
ncbi:MAG: hypothetical protein ACYCZX_08345 [Rhodospirillaceae bacterium]